MKNIYSLFIIFSFSCSAVVAQSDEPCTATPLTVNSTCIDVTGSNVGATASAGIPAPGCANYSGGDVWYSAVVGADGTLNIETSNSGGGINDGGLAVYTGLCGSLTLFDCDDDGGSGQFSEININSAPLAGQTVYIRVWEYGNNNFGDFDICAHTPCPIVPNNDACVSAIAIALSGSESGTTNCASTGAGDPSPGAICAFSLENTVWYTFTAASTQNVFVNVSSMAST